MTNMRIHRGYNHEELAKMADAIRAKYDLEPKMTVSEVLEYGLHKSVEALNAQAIEEEWSEDELETAKRSLKDYENAVNDSRRIDRLYLLESEPFASAMDSYMETQYVSGKAVSVDKEAHILRMADKQNVYLRPFDVIQNICKSESARIIDGAWIFTDNVVKFVLKDDTAHVSKDALGKEYAVIRKRMGWDKYESKNALSKQMGELAVWMVGSAAPKFSNSDLTYIINGVINSDDVANAAGVYKVRETAKLIDLIFRAIYTRKNKLAYKVSSPKDTGNPLTQVPNSDMAEAPAKPEKKPEGGSVKVDGDPAHGSATLEPKADPKAPKAEPKK